jgi:ATPase subunit of ABC transporter with duplicated ATPase domains
MIRQTGETDGMSDGKYISQMRIKDSAIKSGGERTRLAIAAAFSKHAPILFADEPTTNLDVNGIEMLEKMMKGYRGAIVLISHDRKLLDNVCNQIWEIQDGTLRTFPGNYSDWLVQRNRERDFAEFEYNQYQSERKRLEKTIREVKQEARGMLKPPKRMGSSEWMLYKGGAAIQQGHVEGRASAIISRLDHLEKKERPKELPHITMKLGSYKNIKAKIAAKVDNLTVEYDDRCILANTSMQILTGKRTFLIGENGAGKTTLIKSFLTQEDHTFITTDAKIGYFSKHIARAILMNLYMNENDINKKITVLSGGERVKTALAKVLASDCNMLILDEPTNHMDIYTMEGLEALLSSYSGTLLIVSHDRKLVENLAQVIYQVKSGEVIKILP